MARTCDRCGRRAEYAVAQVGVNLVREGMCKTKPDTYVNFEGRDDVPPDVCFDCLADFRDVAEKYFRPAKPAENA